MALDSLKRSCFLTQAAEAFHRQFRPGLYMDPEVFQSKVWEPMRKAIPRP